jgi:hypothetical protein
VPAAAAVMTLPAVATAGIGLLVLARSGRVRVAVPLAVPD